MKFGGFLLFCKRTIFYEKYFKSIKQGKLTDDNKGESSIEKKGGRLSIYLQIYKITSTRTWNKKFQGGKEYEN
jgi:hypothetical protein